LSQMQKKNSALEVELVESHQRSQQLAEENKELFKTADSLRAQVSRLEMLKQKVLSSIQDNAALEAETGHSQLALSDEYLKSATPLTTAEMNLGGHNPARGEQQGPPPQPTYSAPPPGGGGLGGSGAYAPGGMGHYDIMAGGGGGGGGGGAPPGGTPLGGAPLGGSGGGAPQGILGGGGGASNGSPVVDGKQFFRQARSRLSYEAFNLFLASIKRLNNQQQTREDTLAEAKNIFGTELQDLYKDFELLLNRHGV